MLDIHWVSWCGAYIGCPDEGLTLGVMMLCLHWVPWCGAYIGCPDVLHTLDLGYPDGECDRLFAASGMWSMYWTLGVLMEHVTFFVASGNVCLGNCSLLLLLVKTCRPWGRSVLCWDFAVVCYICAFRPDTSDFNKRALSYTYCIGRSTSRKSFFKSTFPANYPMTRSSL